MRQMVMLEKTDLDVLKSGETLTLNVGGAEVVLGLSGAKAQQPTNGARAREIKCPLCAAAFFDPKGVAIHLRDVHHKEWEKARSAGPPYLCPVCAFSASAITSLGRHMGSVHKEQPSALVALLTPAKSAKERFLPPKRGQKLRRVRLADGAVVDERVAAHLRKNGAGARCSYCRATLKNTKRLRDHYRRQHPKEYAKSGPGGPLKCSKCPMRFSSQKELGAHRWMRHNIKGATRQ